MLKVEYNHSSWRLCQVIFKLLHNTGLDREVAELRLMTGYTCTDAVTDVCLSGYAQTEI